MRTAAAEEGRCPECGAELPEEMTCADLLGLVLAWEWNDAELQALHFLTVATFNLQHPSLFTSEALGFLRRGFLDYLQDRSGTAELRRRASQSFEGSRRVLVDAADRTVVFRRWSVTLADVYAGGEPRGAAQRVLAWAKGIEADVSADDQAGG